MATLVVFGIGASGIVERVIQTRRRIVDLAEPVLGRGGDDAEEVVLFRKNDSEVFVHGHGGTAAVASLREAFLDVGAVHAPWEEWVRFSSAESSNAKEARIALARATTEKTAGMLLDQLAGALSGELGRIRTSICRRDWNDALIRTETLRSRLPLGLHLTRPWRVAVAGRPNVGKSSLVNALLGYSRTIVHETPGTTRDVLSAETAFDGYPVVLYDTAGIRQGAGRVERSGISLARRRIGESDLVLFVCDVSAGWTSEDEMLRRSLPEALLVCNKCDLAPGGEMPYDGLHVSALEGLEVPRLIAAIVSRLVPAAPPNGAAIPFTEEHAERLSRLEKAIRGEDETAVRAVLTDWV